MRLLLCIVLGLLATGPVARDASAVEMLTFNPQPDSVTFTVRSTSVREQWFNAERAWLDSTSTTAKAQLSKTASGFRMDTEIIDFGGKRDSVPFDERLLRVMKGLHVALQLDEHGAATAVEGFEGFYERVDSLMEFETAKVLKDMLSPALMHDKELSDWNDRILHLANRQFLLNALRTASDVLMLPDGSSHTLYEVSYIEDTLRVDRKLHARVRILADTSPMRLATKLNQTVSFLSDLFKVPEQAMMDASASVSNYHTESHVVVEASTLLLRSEKGMKEVMLKQIDLPEQKVISRLHETISREYTYTKR